MRMVKPEQLETQRRARARPRDNLSGRTRNRRRGPSSVVFGSVQRRPHRTLPADQRPAALVRIGLARVRADGILDLGTKRHDVASIS